MNPFAPRERRVSVATLGCVMVMLTASRSGFGQSAGNKAAAEAIFDQGKLLMQSGDYPKACEKFEASRKLDEGIGTVLYLADCYEKVGRTASAWAMFKEAASLAGAQGQASRQKLASQRARNLEALLVKLTVEVAKDNGSLLGFEVRNDGVVIPTAQFGSPVPVDPGEHHIEASAPGKRSFNQTVKVAQGVGVVTIPLLPDLAGPAASPLQSETAAPATTTVAPTSEGISPVIRAGAAEDARNDTNANSSKTQRIFAFTLGGIGLVGIGLGSYWGVSAIDRNSQSKTECPSQPNLCSASGVELREDALQAARASTIAFAVGGVALATGAVLFFTAPTRHRLPISVRSAFGPHHSHLSLEGKF